MKNTSNEQGIINRLQMIYGEYGTVVRIDTDVYVIIAIKKVDNAGDIARWLISKDLSKMEYENYTIQIYDDKIMLNSRNPKFGDSYIIDKETREVLLQSKDKIARQSKCYVLTREGKVYNDNLEIIYDNEAYCIYALYNLDKERDIYLMEYSNIDNKEERRVETIVKLNKHKGKLERLEDNKNYKALNMGKYKSILINIEDNSDVVILDKEYISTLGQE